MSAKPAHPRLIDCGNCDRTFNSKLLDCPFCAWRVEVSYKDKLLPCPHCSKPMEKVEEIESVLDVCPDCEGMWCENDTLAEITRERDVYKRDDIPRKFIRKPPPSEFTYIKCPICAKVMNRMNFARLSGIMIDICIRHGIWLDAGEIEEIRRFIANGGIDKAQNQQLIENKIEIEAAARQAKQGLNLIRTLDKFNLKRIALQRF